MSETDFAALIEPVARHFWGEPNKTLSSKVELRWGSGGSRSVKLDGEGFWHDFETNESGGVIKLVMAERKCSKADAIVWLEGEEFIEKRDTGRRDAPGRQEAPPSEHSAPEQSAPFLDEPVAKEKPVKGYRYTDGDGNVLYEVIRYHFEFPDGTLDLGKSGNPRKTFKQRRPDGKGGVIWGLGDVAHTLFRRQQLEIAIADGKTIFLPEGEKDVETVEAWGFAGTTNSGGAQNWRPEFADLLAGADVVILADDDEAGQARVDRIAKDLKGKAARIRAIREWGGHKDVTDWRDKAGGTSDRLAEIIAGLPDYRPRPPQSRMGAIGLEELHRKDLRHEWLIDDFFDRHGVVMMPGFSGSGKSFLTIEAGACIAMGWDFWGMKVRQGMVVYQAGEAPQGVAKRLDGWLMDRGVEDRAAVPFRMLTKKVNLFVDDKDTDDLIAECRAWSEFFGAPMRALFIDTLNKAITGANENAGQDMGKVFSRFERMATELDCAVIVPMHKNKQGDMRGHGSLLGDATNVLNVNELKIHDQNNRIIRTAQLEKNKDGEKGPPHRFVLRQVVVGTKDDGRPITTCVVDRPDGDENVLVEEGRLSPGQTLFLNTLKDSIGIDGIAAPDSVAGVPHGKMVVPYRAFAARLRNKWPFSAGEHEIEKRNQEFTRAMGDIGKRLSAYGYVDRDNGAGIIWWTGRSDRPNPKPRPLEPPPSLPADIKADLSEVPF